MPELKLIVIEADELCRLINEAVQAAHGRSPTDDWVDACSSPFGRRAFLRLAKEGAFPISRLGRKYVARRSDIDAYLERLRLERPPELVSSDEDSPCDQDPIARALAQGRLRIVKNPT